jgi:N-acetylglutamate synthase-like GNAT family acetyltransferase
MIIRIAETTEYPKVRELYEACNYNGGVQDDDLVVIAEDNDLIGAARISREHGVKVLRGMQIHSAHRRKGTGTLMLKFLQENIDMKDCHCIPYKHLNTFYGQIGFDEITPAEAPDFLAERFKKYLKNGLDVVLMKVKTQTLS